jgi:hypothetical protein
MRPARAKHSNGLARPHCHLGSLNPIVADYRLCDTMSGSQQVENQRTTQHGVNILGCRVVARVIEVDRLLRLSAAKDLIQISTVRKPVARMRNPARICLIRCCFVLNVVEFAVAPIEGRVSARTVLCAGFNCQRM